MTASSRKLEICYRKSCARAARVAQRAIGRREYTFYRTMSRDARETGPPKPPRIVVRTTRWYIPV